MDLATIVLRLRGECCDFEAVDRLARLVLAAKRSGATVEVTDLAPDLAALVDLAGLSVEVLGEAEHREQTTLDEGVVGDHRTV